MDTSHLLPKMRWLGSCSASVTCVKQSTITQHRERGCAVLLLSAIYHSILDSPKPTPRILLRRCNSLKGPRPQHSSSHSQCIDSSPHLSDAIVAAEELDTIDRFARRRRKPMIATVLGCHRIHRLICWAQWSASGGAVDAVVAHTLPHTE